MDHSRACELRTACMCRSTSAARIGRRWWQEVSSTRSAGRRHPAGNHVVFSMPSTLVAARPTDHGQHLHTPRTLLGARAELETVDLRTSVVGAIYDPPMSDP